MRCSRENRERGFTLIELLIAMAIALVVITSLSSAFISQRKTYAVQEQMTEMVQGARATMDIISRDVNIGGYDPRRAGIVGIPYNGTQLEIRADLNGDGDTSDPNEIVIYKDSGNLKIERKEGVNSPIILAENIEAFNFKYFKHDSASGLAVEVLNSANEGEIREIEITITARTSKSDPKYGQNEGYRTYTLTSRITPQNLDL